MNLTSTKLTLVTLFAIAYTSVQAIPASSSSVSNTRNVFSSPISLAENDSWFKDIFFQIRASFDAKLTKLGDPPSTKFQMKLVPTPPLEGAHAPEVLRPELLPPPDCACGPTCTAGQLGGQVWEDYNSDGVKSSVETNGVASITVTAYDCTGQAYGPVVTNSCGYYTFGTSIASGKYPVRIEFSNIPSVYNNSSTFNGTNSRTTVQKIATARCDANLGLTDPLEYCQQNPKVVVPQYVNGDPLPTTIGTNPCLGTNQNPASASPSLVSFPSNQTGNFPTPGYSTYSTAAQTGGVWGLAYQKKSKFLFSSAVLKRHVGLGTQGLGGIYITNTTTGVTSNFLKVSAVGVNVGNDANFENGADRGLPEERTCPNADKIGFDNVGKAGIGDIDISDDGTKLFFTNLLDRKVYGLNIDPVNPTAATTSLYGSWSVPNTCSNPGDNRPWALKFNKGKLYVGTVCSQESNQSTAGLTATVFEINVAAIGSTPTQVLQFPLTFTKGRTDGACNVAQNQWKPWTLQFPNPCSGNWIIYPQPVLSDIEFDTNGDMIVGFLDRTGFQTGDENFSPNPETGQGGFNGFAGGDILRAQFNGDGSDWTIENNATVSCRTTAGAGNNQGPGGGEYYFGDFSLFGQSPNSSWHTDAVQGGLALNPATGKVLVTAIDPSDQPWSGGVFQINNATGVRDNGYSIYKRDPGTFGKAAGLGDLEVLCELPPLQIGNYVWLDTDGDGTQDPCEAGLSGVNVTLYNQGGSVIATKQTDGNGEYYFSSSDGVLPNTKYFVAVGTGGQFANGKITLGTNSYGVTTADSGEGSNPDLNDSDGMLNMAGAPTVVLNFPTGMLTTGSEGSVNHTIDFGFALCSVTATASKVDPKCGRSDGSATANPASGASPYTYTWSNGGTTQTISNLPAGTYTVTIKDSYNCTVTASATLNNIAGPTTTISKIDAKCGRADGSATANPTGGTTPYTYTWSNGATSQTINSVLAGVYTVTVKDVNLCTAVASVTITNINGPSTTITKIDAKCGRADGSATANPTGGTTPYTYTWSNGATSQAINNVLAGVYTVTVKDVNLCTAVASVTITNINGPSTTITKVDAKCGRADGSATAVPSGGTSPYTYTWSNGGTSVSINNVLAGSYTVTVKDANLCTATATVIINNIDGPSTTISKVDAKCGRADGSATANPTGGTTPYTYTWSNGATSQTINSVLAGVYTVTVKDVNLCTAVASVTITNINGPSTTITKIDAKCGRADGSATANPTGGTTPYTYTWSNGATSQTINSVLAGVYTVTVKDVNLCTAVASVTITNINGPSTTITKIDAKCGRADGSATAVPSGGTSPYTYTWSNGGTSVLLIMCWRDLIRSL